MNRKRLFEIVNSHAPVSIVPLDLPNLFGLDFRSMKIYPAAGILSAAWEAGEIGKGSKICETSSGTMALGAAIVARQMGLKLTIFGDPVIDPNLKYVLEALGTNVELVETDVSSANVQMLRKERLEEFRAKTGAMWIAQYDNPHNRYAYGIAAEKAVTTLGAIDCLVATVGSGGSSCGLAGYFREFFEEMELIGVDTFGSVIFGQSLGTRELRGLGNSIVPDNVLHQMFDEVHWLGAKEAYHATHDLLRNTCFKRGPTSGAAYIIARHYAFQNPDKRVLAVFPDDSLRYETTIFDTTWLSEQGYLNSKPVTRPTWVSHPSEAHDGWCRIKWGRRIMKDVLNQPRQNFMPTRVGW